MVPEGFVITEAEAPLVPPLIDSPTENPEDDDTVIVIVPIGYVAMEEEEESRAKVNVFCSTVHRFKPLFAHSANNKFKERLAVAAS
ncbi:MAG: hypothetical protein CMG85_24320 [Marinobacter sp.]|nr:hypothetical protein [Marinobacter sp.]